MLWIRLIVGLALTYLLLNGPIIAALHMAGVLQTERVAIAGPGGEDNEALTAPFEHLRQGDTNWVAERVADVPPAQARDQVQAMRAALPAQYQNSRMLTWRRTNSTGGQFLTGVFDHDYVGYIVRSDIALKRATGDAPWSIESFNLNVVERARVWSPIQALLNRQPLAWGAALAAALGPIFIVLVLWAVLLKRRLKGRWVWVLVSIISVGAWSMNLSTGENSIDAVMVQVLSASGASWSGSPLDAWMVKVCAPFGAAIAWFNLGMARDEEAEAAP